MIGLPLWFADYGLWLVCAAFYVVDNIRLVDARKMVVAEDWTGLWSPVLPLHNVRFGGRTVAITLFRPPWGSAVVAQWLLPAKDGGRPSLRRQITPIARRSRLPGLIGAASLVNLLIACPLLTIEFGLGHAMLWALVCHLIVLVVFTGMLVIDRRAWGMSGFKVAGLVFECAVCPGYLCNLGRHLGLAHGKVVGDPMAYSLALAQKRPELAYRIKLMVDEVEEVDQLGAGEVAEVRRLRGKVTRLRTN